MATARSSEREIFDARRTLRALVGRMTEWAHPALVRAALVLVGEVKLMLSRPGTGRLYKSRGIRSRLARRGTKRRAQQTHRASAPGEPPAPDTGQLRASVTNLEQGGEVLVATVQHYASALEYGTKSRAGLLKRNLLGRRGPSLDRRGLADRLRKASASRSLVQSVRQRGSGRLDPRPFMRPALEKARPQMLDVLVSDARTLIARRLPEG